MFPAEFDYYRAGSVAEAAELLAKHADAKVLAGGHSLIPVLKLRLAAPSALVDIGRLDDLRGISTDGPTIRIGALTTHAQLAASDVLQERAAALAEAAGMIGDPAVRNRATIGGNVAHADPASDLPQVLCCLRAELVIAGASGERRVAADDFFEGLMTTALGEAEILTAVEIPGSAAGEGSAYAKFAHPASRYAVMGAAAAVTVTGGACTAASVVIGGACPVPTRAAAVEQALVGRPPIEDAVREASQRAGACLDDDEVLGDIYASSAYRKSLAHVWVRRALGAAVARSG